MPEFHSEAKKPTKDELISMRARMNAFIFPNVPVTEPEKRAFEHAVKLQIEHERRQLKALHGNEMPDGVTQFTIGHFTMAFEQGAISSKLTRKTICDAAYGELLTAGLLYRGVERDRGCGACL